MNSVVCLFREIVKNLLCAIMRLNLNVFLNSSNDTESAIHGLPVSCFAKVNVLSCF